MTEIDLAKANKQLAAQSAPERIQYAVDLFGEKAVLLSSMQKTASVLMHMFYTAKLNNEILFVDTQFHFFETLMIRDEFMRKYKLNINTLYPKGTCEQQEAKYGCKLYKTVEGQPVCCDLRKTKPFIGHMKKAGHKLVMGGLRRKEGQARAGLDFLSVDPRFGGYKLNPILDWTDEKVSEYLEQNDVPVHSLHSKCYPSIGCECCTTPVMPGESNRAGRWRHLNPDGEQEHAYCGINYSDGGGI